MKGNIYIIKSKQTDKVYVGSTIQCLNRRFSEHKSNKDCTSVEILKYNDAEIELLECYECENKEQLRKKEGEYIKQYNCVNLRIEGRTQREYLEDYYEDNKEDILEKRKEKFTCECGITCRKSDRARHLKTKKHIKFVEF